MHAQLHVLPFKERSIVFKHQKDFFSFFAKIKATVSKEELISREPLKVLRKVVLDNCNYQGQLFLKKPQMASHEKRLKHSLLVKPNTIFHIVRNPPKYS